MDINNTVSLVGESVQAASKIKSNVGSETKISNIKLIAKTAENKQAEAKDEKVLEFPEKNVERAITDVNQFFQSEQRKLSFSVNQATKDVVIEVKDAETDEILRQIPPEFVVRLAEQLNELSNEQHASSGLLLQDKA